MLILDKLKSAVLRLFGGRPAFSGSPPSWGSGGGAQSNDDPVLQEFAGAERIAYYARIRRQVPRVSGLFKLRIDAARALPSMWIAGDPEDDVSLYLRDVYDQAWDALPDRDAGERQAMFCIADGLAFLELVYFPFEFQGLVPETLIIPRLVDQRPEFFEFDKDENLLFRSATFGAERKKVDPRQVIIVRYGSARLHGRGEMSDCHPDAWKLLEFDRMGLKALAKQGYPLMLIHVPEQWGREAQLDYARPIQARYPNTLLWPDSEGRTFIDFPDRDVSPTFIGGDQLARMDWAVDSMSINILGVKFSNNEVGSNARDQVAAGLLFDKASGDARIRDHIANQWRDRVAEINHPTVPKRLLPRHVTDAKPTEDLIAWMDAWAQAVDRGAPLSLQQLAEKQGFQLADTEDDTVPGKPVAPAPLAQPVAPVPQITEPEQGLSVMSEAGDITFTPWERVQEFLLAQQRESGP